MATVAWVIMKHHKKSDGTYNPKIRISHNGTSSYIPTQIYTELVRFKKGSSSGVLTSGIIKSKLDEQIRSIRDLLNDNIDIVNQAETSKQIIELIERKNASKNIDFISFARKNIYRIKNKGTRSVKTTGINSLCHYLKETTGNDTLYIKNLNSAFLRKYEEWLRKERVLTIKVRPGLNYEFKSIKRPALNDTGIHSYMGIIQSIFNNALMEYNDYEIGDIVIVHNPFKAYKMPKILSAKKRAVDIDTIKKIYNFTPTNKKRTTTMFARDIYMLSFFLAGINIVDLYNLKQTGKKRVEYERQKTKDRKKDKGFISLCIHDEAKIILDKYKDPKGEMLLNLYDEHSSVESLTQAVNRGLRSLCKDLNIECIQYYSARHSFATIARNDCEISKDDIALCLTHSSGMSVTDTYIKEDYSRIDIVINKVIDKIFDKKPLSEI